MMSFGRALGRPVQTDETTLKKEISYYASVLIEIDLAKAIPDKIWVESKYGGFSQKVQIPKIPKFCNHCKVVGHFVAECKTKRKENSQVGDDNSVLLEKLELFGNPSLKKFRFLNKLVLISALLQRIRYFKKFYPMMRW